MKIDIPEHKKRVHEMLIPIRWGDMDAMGHLNNGTYFRYLETIRIDWMYAIGCKPDPLDELVVSFCSTEFIDGSARDNQATNAMEIKETGFA